MVGRRKNMRINMITLAAMAFVLFSATVNAESIVVFRNSNGELGGASNANAKIMKQRIREDGFVTLWLTLDFPFNVNMGEMTQQEIDEQAERVSAEFDVVLDPLVDEGIVWHPRTGKFVKGPGCVVRANGKGLKHLLRDERILQLTALNE